MEMELFDWDDWDDWDGEQECMTFYKVTLKKAIGRFPIGSAFSLANILQNPEEGTRKLQLVGLDEEDNVEKVYEFELHYQVGKEITGVNS